MGKSLVTGIEIGHHSIKAVVLKPNKRTLALVDHQELPLEAGIFSDNHMSNYQKIVKKLKELRKCLPRFSRKVALSIPDNSVISKVLQIDSKLDSQEVEYAISHAFSRQSPFPIEELNLDYVELGLDNAGETRDFQVYATKKATVAEQVAMFKCAGLEPIVVDMRSHGLVNLWQRSASVLGTSKWLMIDIEMDQFSLCMDFPDKASFCKQIILTNDTSESKTHDDPFRSPFANPSVIGKIQRCVQQVASVHDVTIQGIWLVGNIACISCWQEELCRSLPLECQVLNPLALFSESAAVHCVAQNAEGSQYASAAGMALRGIDWLNHSYAA
ncbi:pilus assembly protein PilM [Vibrio galatheae]|uniref:Pilus assembly protein PilM n=1 Tax=Vibrio galatheae TaxID=579748 RepID=A0A0F4NI80_9VIBR|nr:type IV pilus assembly protein PilM [Vibrio galatheae]KJY82644.1 pilus assembly protein PilM [Vibrio galatheae]